VLSAMSSMISATPSLLSLLTMCSISFLLAPPARSAEPIEPSLKQLGQTRLLLLNSTDPDSLALAALLSSGDQSLALIEHATAAAPDRADLVMLQLDICQKVNSCEVVAIEHKLRQRDPLNAAGWAGDLVRASAANDEAARDIALIEMSRKQRFDTYYTALAAQLGNAAASTHKLSREQALTLVIGYLAAQPIPVYETASKACKGERLQRSGVIEACKDLARVFQQGDTYLTEIIGIAIAKRVWPEDSAEWKAATETRRVYDYRSKLWIKLFGGDEQLDEYLKLAGVYHREQDLWAAQLIAAGVNPSPPVE
jgi:hypothetical protein